MTTAFTGTIGMVDMIVLLRCVGCLHATLPPGTKNWVCRTAGSPIRTRAFNPSSTLSWPSTKEHFGAKPRPARVTDSKTALQERIDKGSRALAGMWKVTTIMERISSAVRISSSCTTVELVVVDVAEVEVMLVRDDVVDVLVEFI